MTAPFIFINTYTIKPGRLEDYKEAFQRIAELVEAEEPKMLYFASHLSEDGTEATTVQVHADAENMAHHMQVAEEEIRATREVLEFSSMSIQVYGSPTEAILEQMSELSGSGVPVTIRRPTAGFDRFPAT